MRNETLAKLLELQNLESGVELLQQEIGNLIQQDSELSRLMDDYCAYYDVSDSDISTSDLIELFKNKEQCNWDETLYLINVSSLWQQTTKDFYMITTLPKFKVENTIVTRSILGEAVTVESLEDAWEVEILNK